MRGSRLSRKLWPWGAAALSGLLLALCFPGWNQSWLCWVALAPLTAALWFSTNGGGWRWLKKAGLGYVAGLTFFSATFRWLNSLADLFHSAWLLALPLLLSCYLALYFAFWGWFLGCVAMPAGTDPEKLLSSRSNLRLGFLCAAAWVAQEWLRGVVFGGFGWNGLGVALHGSIALIQIADVTGVAGLSFVIALCNVIAVVTIRRFALEIRKGRLRPHYDFSLTLALAGIVFAYGVRVLFKQTNTTELRVAAVQPNIPQNEKFGAASEERIFQRYESLTGMAMTANPQLMLWPESALPRGMFEDQTNYDFVHDLAAKSDAGLLLGTDDRDEKGYYNTAVLVSDRGAALQEYRKIHLVPFGEYMPLRHSFPLFAWIAGDLVPDDFLAGKDCAVLQLRNPPVKLGALICFEDTLGDLTRRFVLNGAQVLVNVTNDGWFLKSPAAQQHLANAIFRAVETRRPLIRCANTGVTCLIDSTGRINESLPLFTEGFLSGRVNVPVNGALTFYTRHGEWFSLGALGVTLFAILSRFLNRRK